MCVRVAFTLYVYILVSYSTSASQYTITSVVQCSSVCVKFHLVKIDGVLNMY